MFGYFCFSFLMKAVYQLLVHYIISWVSFQTVKHNRKLPDLLGLTLKPNSDNPQVPFPYADAISFDSPSDEPEVPMEPPSATTTTTIGISATWTTLAGSHGKRNNTITTTSSKRKNRKNKITPDNVQILFDDQLPISYSQPEKVNGESKSSSTSESGDSDNMRISSCSDESSNSNSSHKSDNHSSTAIANPQNKKQPSVLVTFPKDERKAASGKSSIK